MLVGTPLKTADLDSTRERYSGGAFHPNVFAVSVPRDLEISAGQLDLDGGIESAMTSADGDSRASSGAARQGFADAAFENTQPDVRAIDDFHEADVHAVRESWVALDRGAQAIDWCARDRGDREHGVGIAHRHRADLDFSSCDGERIDVRLRGSVERQRLRLEIRSAHVHGDQVGVVHARADQPRRAVEQQLVAAVRGFRAAPMEERGEAARAVAALLDLAAVGVEDAVVDLRALAARRLEDERLIETNPGMTRGQRTPLLGGRQAAVARRIEHDEIVAEAVHLRELELHGAKDTVSGYHSVPCG